ELQHDRIRRALRGMKCRKRAMSDRLYAVGGGGGRNRTGVDGFAGRCMTTLPPRLGGRRLGQRRRQTKRESALALPWKLERETSLELATSTLARLRSTN